MFLDACLPSWHALVSLQFSPALDSCMLPFGAYYLEVSPTPPWAEPAGSSNPISTAYSSFSKSDSVYPYPSSPLFTTHTTHMPPWFIKLLPQADTSVLKEQGKTGRDVCSWAPRHGGSSQHPASQPSPLACWKRQSLHHDTFSVKWLVNSSCC